MNVTAVAELIFWSGILAVAMFVYQQAVLPGIRLTLRYRTFSLRDQLRTLVINGTVKESNPAFQLLHHQLNYMCSSLSTYDLARLAHSASKMDEQRKAQIHRAMKMMEEAPAEIRKIYEESLNVCVKALIFNSLFFFIVATTGVIIVYFFKVGVLRLKAAVLSKVQEDIKVGFFAPELAAV
jgi:hypothetical protein